MKDNLLADKVKRINQFALRKKIYPAAVAGCAITILVSSIMPEFGGGINSGFYAHGLAYFVFSLSIILFLQGRCDAYACVKALISAGTFGIFIELLQFLLPYRAFEVSDIIVNWSAATVAAVPGYYMIKKEWI